MSARVSLRDGVVLDLADGTRVVLDGATDGDVTVLSHAHGDHLVAGAKRVVASELTAALADVRQDGDGPTPIEHPAIELFPAGHIAGSRAARITDPATGRTYLYTGDVSTRNRFYLGGFEPVEADVLITEATYGEPDYVFPPTETVLGEIHEWLAATMDTVVVLFGYALGRAQKLQRVLAESPRSRVFVTEAIAALNDPIATELGVEFPADRYDTDIELRAGDALVLPMGTTRIDWIDRLVEDHDAITAGFSGWAVDDSFVYRRGLDEGFVLSDHCDFPELVDLVEAVDPETVYTQHGAADALASHLATASGYDATALKENQTTLGEF